LETLDKEILMRRSFLTMVPWLAIVVAGCAAPGAPRPQAATDACRQQAGAPHAAASGAMSMDAKHREMHARMHGGQAAPAGEAKPADHAHEAAAAPSCPPAH
jgi:hypothetical protein